MMTSIDRSICSFRSVRLVTLKVLGSRLTDLAVPATFRPHVATVLRRRGWKTHLEKTAAMIRPVPSPCGVGTCSGDPTDGDAFRHVSSFDGRG